MQSGVKEFRFAPPTKNNLEIYREKVANGQSFGEGKPFEGAFSQTVAKGESVVIVPGFIHEVVTSWDACVIAGNFILEEYLPLSMYYHQIDVELNQHGMPMIDCFAEVVAMQIESYLKIDFAQRAPWQHETLLYAQTFFQHFYKHHLPKRANKTLNFLTRHEIIGRFCRTISEQYNSHRGLIQSGERDLPTQWPPKKMSLLPPHFFDIYYKQS